MAVEYGTLRRALAVEGSNVIALRNPIRESQIVFEKRAIRLAFEAAGLEVGDADYRDGAAAFITQSDAELEGMDQ